MKRAAAGLALAALIGVAGGAFALRQAEIEVPPPPPATEPDSAATPAADAPAAPVRPAAPINRVETPMAQRVATIGLLNKRNGISRDFRMHPGEAIRAGDVVIRLRACETTASWEPQQLTGAFIQTDVRSRDGQWRRVFSGWLFKESPSLNVVEHPIYDVWPKACEMKHPDVGPDTVPASAPGAASRSTAKKSTDEDSGSVTPGATPTPPAASASSSSTR